MLIRDMYPAYFRSLANLPGESRGGFFVPGSRGGPGAARSDTVPSACISHPVIVDMRTEKWYQRWSRKTREVAKWYSARTFLREAAGSIPVYSTIRIAHW